MRHALVAVVVLLTSAPVAAGAGTSPTLDPTPLPTPSVAVTCYFGSDPISVPAERVSAVGGGLRIEHKGTVHVTTVPCIAEIPLGFEPAPKDIALAVCLDHAGESIYKAEIFDYGFTDGVLWWYEKDGDGGYKLVLSSAQCMIVSDTSTDPTD